MSPRLPFLSLLVAGLLVVGGTVAAGAKLYSWRDKSGSLHYTDNIEQVPEPFRSQFLHAEERTAGSRGGEKPPAAAPRSKPGAPRTAPPRMGPGSGPRLHDRDEIDKLRWQAEVRKLRDGLAKAEQQLARLEQDRANSMRRWRETRVVARRQEAEELGKKIAELQEEAERLRHELEVELPRRAKREGVPPGWLR